MQHNQDPARQSIGTKEAEDSLTALGVNFTQYVALVDAVVAKRMGPSAYQGSVDAQMLLSRQAELLNPDAQALSDLFREAERDALTREKYGASYDQLDSAGKLAYHLLHSSLTGSEGGDCAVDIATDVNQGVETALMERNKDVSEVEIVGWTISYTDVATADKFYASISDSVEGISSVEIDRLRVGQRHWAPVTLADELVSIATRLSQILGQAKEIVGTEI